MSINSVHNCVAFCMNLNLSAIPAGQQRNYKQPHKSSNLYMGKLSYFSKDPILYYFLITSDLPLYGLHMSCIFLFLDFSPMAYQVHNCSMYLHALVCLYYKAWFSVHSIWIPPITMSDLFIILLINEILLLVDTVVLD